MASRVNAAASRMGEHFSLPSPLTHHSIKVEPVSWQNAIVRKGSLNGAEKVIEREEIAIVCAPVLAPLVLRADKLPVRLRAY